MNPTDVVKGAGAVAAIVSPWWLTIIKTVSEGAALILPVMGVIWLVIQMTDYFTRKKK